ncbi:MAG TPA: redoxin domain-containing protein [Bryobacteraceae bacterium]|jgi:peroxiredoxin
MAQILLTFVLSAWFAIFAAAAPLQFRLLDVHGGVHTAAEWSGRKAIVLFFVVQDCPVGNSYVPEMNRIEQTYSPRGVRFYAVQADVSAAAAVTAEYARDYRFVFPLLLDSSQVLVRLAGATVTPQAVILSPGGEVLYRGRIDNRVEDFGSQRPEATVHDLRDALDAVLAGHQPRVRFTRSIGCAITRLPQK